tara:strand:+ start:121 stop:483 length:363 start_codon:yes stop_codon:yes gene_type:complete
MKYFIYTLLALTIIGSAIAAQKIPTSSIQDFTNEVTSVVESIDTLSKTTNNVEIVFLNSTAVQVADDPSGTNSKWAYFIANPTMAKDVAGNWRMGVTNSQFIVQIYTAGSWKDAVAFTAP